MVASSLACCVAGCAVACLGCVPQPATFRCSSDGACMQGGVAGHCEETGFCSFPDATCGTGQNRYGEFAGDDLAGTCVVPRITPLAPSATNRMYQGTQRGLRRNGVACTARIAAGIGQTAFCFLGADDDVKCAGTIGGVSYGPSFVSIGLGAVEQIMMIFGDIGSGGMCATRTDHVVVCQGSDPNVFATSEIVPASFTPWTTLHFATIVTDGWDDLCGLTIDGDVFCQGVIVGRPGHIVGHGASVWIDAAGMVKIDDPDVLRPGEGFGSSCGVTALGLRCGLDTYGPRDNTVVSGNGDMFHACWLTDDGTVTCDVGPRFERERVVLLAQSWQTDSQCAIYSDGSVWCIGPNDAGKLGTGDQTALVRETRVAPPGSARVHCDD